MFVALRDLRFAKGRFALMGSVVVLITMLVGLLSGLTSGLAKESTSGITGLHADQLVFQGSNNSDDDISFDESTVSEKTLRQWRDVSGVDAAEPLAIQRSNAAPGKQAEDSAGSSSVAVFGVQPGSSLAPELDELDTGTVVLSQDAADELSVSEGQSIAVGGARLDVAGISGDASYSHSPVVWTSMKDYQRATGAESGAATVLALRGTDDVDLSAADERAGTHTVSVEDSVSAIESFNAENSSLRLMRGFLFAISALVIGAFFTVWTIQRSADVAVLKALGASTGYLLRDALGQAVLILVAGTAVGAGLAAGLGALAMGTVPFVLDIGTTVLPGLVMIVLGAAGAGLAIRKITAVDPLTALGSAR